MLFITSKMLGNKYVKVPFVPIEYGYAMLCVLLIYIAGFSYTNFTMIRENHLIKKRDGYQYDKHDLKFEKDSEINKVMMICIFAGLMGGVVGIGGGIILSPIFLEMGMLP
jgi:uncharacterized membrane protein YfcA